MISEAIEIRELYTIVRQNDEKKEYYAGMICFGKDDENVLRVGEVNWSNTFTSTYAAVTSEKMEDILKGICKYNRMDKHFDYYVAKVEISYAITKLMEPICYEDLSKMVGTE